MPLLPPKWLPSEDIDLWDRAVSVFENKGTVPTYGGVVAVYNIFRKKEGRDKEQNLPGFDLSLSPDEEKIVKSMEQDEQGGSGLHSVDEWASTGEPGAKVAADESAGHSHLSHEEVQNELMEHEQRLAVLLSEKARLDARIKEVQRYISDCEQGLNMSDAKVAAAPPEWEGTVKKLKKHKDKVDNPWALTWWMKGKGYQPGGKKSSFTFKSVESYRKQVYPRPE